MAKKEETSSVAFEADISQFTKSIGEMRSDIKLINSQFEASSSKLDDWSKSSEGLEMKIKQLNGTLDAEKNKLKALQGTREEYNNTLDKNKGKLALLNIQYKKLVEAEGEGSDNAEKLAKDIAKLENEIDKNAKSVKYYETEMNKQQATINKTEKELDSYQKSLNDVGKETKEASESTGGFSKALKGIGGGVVAGIKAIGVAAAGTATSFIALAESTREFREDQARLNAAFEAAKLSGDSASETYKTLFGAIGEADTAVEASQQIALLANSEEEAAKWADLATGVVGKFGDALKAETFFEAANETLKLGEATGAYTQMLEGSGYSVEKFNAGLTALNTEEEKQAYMLEISNQLLGEAGEAYNKIAGDIIEAREAEAELSQATAKLGEVSEPIVTILKTGLAGAIEYITPLVSRLGNAFELLLSDNKMTGLQRLGEIFMDIKDKINEALINILNGATEIIPQMLPKIAEMLGQMIQKFVEFMPTLLNAAIQLLGAIVEALPPTITKLIEQLPLILNSIVASLNEMIPALLEAAIQFLSSIISALPSVIAKLTEALPQLLTTITGFLQENLPLVLNAFMELLMQVVYALPSVLVALAEALPTIIGAIVDFIVDNLPLILEMAIELFNQIIAAIPMLIIKLNQALPTIISKIVKTLLENAPKILAMGFELFMNIVAAIPKMIVELAKEVPKIGEEILNSLAEYPEKMLDIGKDIISGLIDGLADGAKGIWNTVSDIGDNIIGGFKDFFGIHSPSRLMRDEVGEYLGEGMALGIGDGFDKEIGNVRKSVLNNMDFETPDINGSIQSSTQGGKTVNLNYTVNSPKQLSRREMYIQAQKAKTILGGVI